MTYAFNDITVSTWRRTPQGDQTWHVCGGEHGELEAEIVAPRDSDPMLLHDMGIAALGDMPHPGET